MPAGFDGRAGARLEPGPPPESPAVGHPPGSTSCAAVRRSNERARIATAPTVAPALVAMRHNRHVTNPDRLTGLDASFLALEDGGAHMHVGSVMLFEGESPPYEDLVAHVERRLALVP